jgi:PEP-CTERM/exosortase A-associated glycosyltransferase
VRILHVLDHSLPLHSGYAFRTASILREQRALGWETRQLTTPRQGACDAAEETSAGFTFSRTAFRPGALSRLPAAGAYLDEMRATAARLDEIVAGWPPDVIHAHSPVLAALPAIWIGRKRRIPVVYEMRASWEDAAVDHGSTREGSLRYRVSRSLETFALARVAAITTICEGLRREIEARGIAPERITVIPNAVDAAAFHCAATPDAALRTQRGLDGCEVIGFAGSFYGYEGLDLLLDAAALLAAERPTIRVLLVGGGPQEAALRAQAARLGIGERVVFTGRVAQSEVQRYYELVDVLAYPRRSMRLTELVTPLKPLEAMAQGRMFVASDVGGHRELVRDGETGTLFRAGDVGALAAALGRLLQHREQWPTMRAAARRFVENERTWARSVARYRDVYARALAERNSAAPDVAVPGR